MNFRFNFQVIVILLLSHRLKWSILKWPQENNQVFLERLNHCQITKTTFYNTYRSEYFRKLHSQNDSKYEPFR